MEHTWKTCNCDNVACPICDGGLAICTVCGGAEGTLTSDCCGFKLDESVLQAVYHGGLNYRDGKWYVRVDGQPWYKSL